MSKELNEMRSAVDLCDLSDDENEQEGKERKYYTSVDEDGECYSDVDDDQLTGSDGEGSSEGVSDDSENSCEDESVSDRPVSSMTITDAKES